MSEGTCLLPSCSPIIYCTLLGNLTFSGWKSICWGRLWKGICLMHTCHHWASYTCDTVKPFHFFALWEYDPQIKHPGPKPAENAGRLSTSCRSLWPDNKCHSFVSGSGHISNIYWGGITELWCFPLYWVSTGGILLHKALKNRDHVWK